MPERKLSRVQEYWRGVQQQIVGEITPLLQQGHVLTTQDVANVSSRYGYSPTSVMNATHLIARYENDELFVGSVRIAKERVHGYEVIRNADIPVEQTDFETVRERLKEQVAARGRHNFPWLQKEKPE